MTENTALERLTKLTDVWTPRMVIGVILAAFVLSFAALLDLARQAGYHPWLAFLWPLTMDGVIIITSLALVKRQMRGDQTGYIWFLLILFDGVSIFLNGSAGYAGNTLRGWSFALVHALPPLTMVLTLKLLTGEVKDDGRHAGAIQTLTELTQQIDQKRAQTEALSEDVSTLEVKKLNLEADVKELQGERRDAKKAVSNGDSPNFSPETLERAKEIYDRFVTEDKDRFGAALGREVGVNARNGRKLVEYFRSLNGHSNGQDGGQ